MIAFPYIPTKKKFHILPWMGLFLFKIASKTWLEMLFKNDEFLNENIKDTFAAIDLVPRDKHLDHGIFGGNWDSVDWHVS